MLDSNMKSLQHLSSYLDYTFSDAGLLELALTHRSASGTHNERLEFLGDAILGFVIADLLYARFPDFSEGELTRLRARLVRRQTLAEVARQLGLGGYVILGGGEIKSGGDHRESTLADAMEAIIGAVYLDGGLDACRQSILHVFGPRIGTISNKNIDKDAKTRLQELVQGMRLPLPEYRVIEAAGADHQHWFTVECKVAVLPETTRGNGGSRRVAEQKAAEKALDQFERRNVHVADKDH
uniref:Ribonuclease 3 n=1 Tax=Candidatus Kentrum sp. SD TaxID=2126332 RepID=A0A451BJS2_9GAMM|nr:MAG: RNAse III [Candidatus Kentron sp. SD]VFK43825.1 MAG: RNAse III [Candidatus Kentron sp. SD]VFK78543.1 MAG: RNAse III [Candidatus Kentron sp. SD]